MTSRIFGVKVKVAWIAIGIGVAGFLFQILLQAVFRTYTPDGVHFQAWPSETMMQTVAIEDLYTSPLETLWNIHIQPPGLDVIRAILVHLWPSPDDPVVAGNHVDSLLYILWSIMSGLLCSVIFLWSYRLTNLPFALLSTFGIMLHPASILYTTFLETTILSTMLIALMYYLLWKVGRDLQVSVLSISIVVLTLLFTRSIFQWPFILLFAISLLLSGMDWQRVAVFTVITSCLFGLYLYKQNTKFGLLTTSSFTGLNLVRSVSIGEGLPSYWDYLNHEENIVENKDLPRVLTRIKKATGSPNFNNVSYLTLNQKYLSKYLDYVKKVPLLSMIKGYRDNLRIYLRPSSAYTDNLIADRIPWRSLYNRIFSWPILVILMFLAGVFSLRIPVKKRQLGKYIGLALPGLYIFSVCVLAERGENMRFKFFIEPLLILFVVAQFYEFLRQIISRPEAQAFVERHWFTKAG